MHKTILTAIIGLGLLFASTAGAAKKYEWPRGKHLHTSVISNLPVARDSGMQSALPAAHTPLPAKITMRAAQLRNSYQSTNWDGYVDTINSPSNAFRSVGSTFRVPSVHTLTTTDGPAGNMAAQWAGLDGLHSSSVEQTGVVEWLDSSFGIPHYVAWWEMFPAPMVGIADVHPGDLMRATTSWYGPKVPSGFHLTVTDMTQHQTWAVGMKFNHLIPPRNSSEVITELPSSTNGAMALTDFGNVTYNQAATSTTTAPHSLRTNLNYTLHQITLVDSSGNSMAGVTNLANGTTFNTPFVSNGKW
jgi:hypothetical protein